VTDDAGTATRAPRLDADEIVVVAAGVAFALLAFLPWYEARLDLARVTLRGWDLGFAAVAAVLLSLYAAGRVVFLRGRPPKPDVPVTPQAETFAASVAAVALMLYRLIDVPTVPDSAAVRTAWIAPATLVVVLQAVCAARKLGRTGLRAPTSE
jgi:hypothetical protein